MSDSGRRRWLISLQTRFRFVIPDAGEHFSERDVFTWHDERHELQVQVVAAETHDALARVAANARQASWNAIRDSTLQVIGDVARESSVEVPVSFVTAAPPDRSCLFTQGVIEGRRAVMFATLESSAYEPGHVQTWATFLRSIRERE
jgi:hypothetical protein